MKAIMGGGFNLFNVSFPIKCMGDWSMVNAIGTMACTAPYYMTASALRVDPVERMKFLIAGQISYQFPCHKFAKPLNPILGETFSGELDDGTEIYCEQTCHHPPTTSVHMTGPEGLYEVWFHTSLAAKVTGWNSIYVDATGEKKIKYRDGTIITFSNPDDQISSCVWGEMTRRITKRIEYKDEKNNITAWYEPGNVKKKVQDFFSGEILKDGKVVSKIYGNYVGFLNFDDERFWDVRQ